MPTDNRTWTIGTPTIYSYPGSVGIDHGEVSVGGTSDVEVHFSSSDISDDSDVTLHVKGYDSGIVSVESTSVQLDSSGNGTLVIQGVSVGSTYITVEDAIGDEATAGVDVVAPGVISTGSETQGATYTANDMPGFTFSLGAVSLTPVTVDYNTLGSTLPASLLGNLLAGSVTIDAGEMSQFVPFTVPDDGKIAPTRVAVVNLVVPNDAQPGRSTMNVYNTDLPTITMNGESNNAAIAVDPQGDKNKLATISLTENIAGGTTLVSSTMTWSPGEFLMWPSDQIGPAGTDLASLPNAHFYLGSGLETYTWEGKAPADVYGQGLIGSGNWDTTSVSLTANVSVASTSLVPLMSNAASNHSDGTINGPEIVYNGNFVTDKNAGTVVVGQGVWLYATWLGPGGDIDNTTSFVWNTGNAVAGYTVSDQLGSVIPLNANIITPGQSNQLIHFYWVSGPSTQDVNVVWETTTGVHSASTKFNLVTPSSFFVLNTDDTTQVTTTGFPQLHLGPSPVANGAGIQDGVDIYGDAQMASFTGGTLGIFQFGTLSGMKRTHGRNLVVDLLTYNNATDGNVPEDDSNEGGLNHGSAGSSGQVAFNDSPLVNLVGFNYVEVDETFKDYLMYKPDGDGIWVPLRMLNWSWGGTATGDGNQFVGAGLVTPPPVVSSTKATQEPTWSSNIPISGPVWTQILPPPG